MKAKSKIFILITIGILFFLMLGLAIASVFASSKQTFKTGINISYTAQKVNGTASAQWKRGVDDDWTDMTDANGNTVINFKDGTQASLGPNEELNYNSEDDGIYFKYNFTNSAQLPCGLTLTYQDEQTPDINMAQYCVVDAHNNILEANMLNTIIDFNEEFKNNLTTCILPNSTLTLYFLIKPIKATNPASFSGSFNFNLNGEDVTQYDKTFTYYTTNNRAIITGTVEDITELSVPDSLNGFPVKAIENLAFYNKTNLTQITDFANVDTIGSAAFYGSGLSSNLTLGNNLKTIGTGAFASAGITGRLNIPNSVTTINRVAFYECLGITSLTLGQNLTTLGMGAFANLQNLTEINFNSINMPDLYPIEEFGTAVMQEDYDTAEAIIAQYGRIENNAIFANAGREADGITLNFGDGVTHVPATLFSPAALDATNIALYLGSFGSLGDANSLQNADALAVYPNITKINFNQIKTIGACAFQTALVKYRGTLEIPEGVTSIGSAAFSCNVDVNDASSILTGIQTIRFPSTLQSMGYFTTAASLSIKTVYLDSPNILNQPIQNESDIYKQTFFIPDVYMSVLRNLRKPISDLYVTAGTDLSQSGIVQLFPLYGIFKMESDADGYDKYAAADAEINALTCGGMVEILDHSGEFTTDSEVWVNNEFKIKLNAEYDADISVQIARGEVLDNMFAEAYDSIDVDPETNTYSFKIDKLVYASPLYIRFIYKNTYMFDFTSPDDIAIRGVRDDLSTIEIPSSILGKPVTTLDIHSLSSGNYDEFGSFNNLTQITIPSSIKLIRGYFNKLNSIVYLGSTEDWVNGPPQFGAYYDRQIDLITNDGPVESYEFTSDVKYNAFEYVKSLKTVIFREGVTSIGNNAFYQCGGITNVIIDSAAVYNQLTVNYACGGLLDNIDTGGTIKVKQSVVESNSVPNYLNNNFDKSEQAKDGYYTFTKK